MRVLSVGKTKESWLNAAIDEYLVRLRPNLAVDCEWVRDDDALVAAADESAMAVRRRRTGRARSVALDGGSIYLASWMDEYS